MAKFQSYFVLCPLIDQKSFLGISQYQETEDVIVTLGRNVVNEYRLSDQKQVKGWTSKDHITSAVIYDSKKDSYVGVFNKNTIKIWQDDSENLDKAQKFKFNQPILKLEKRQKKPSLIIFEDGNCASLTNALEKKISADRAPILKEFETIVDSASYRKKHHEFICYIIKDNKDRFQILSSPIKQELGDRGQSEISRVKIEREDDVYVVGEHISTAFNPTVYVLWSDSKMTMYNLLEKSWKTVGSVPWISTLNYVSIATMGKDHLILFGSNTDQDGAIIVAYNIVLGVGSCRYPMKMYTKGARLYCFGSRIILEASNHIGMLHYRLETNRHLSTLLGSHEIVHHEFSEIADWGTSVEPTFPITSETKDLIKLGLSERSMCSQVVLPLLEKNDHKHILRVLKQFQDVPETVLIQVMNYTLKAIGGNSFELLSFKEFSSSYTAYQGKEKFQLLNYLFEINFSDALLIPYLKETLSLDDSLFLLTYISYILFDEETDIGADFESKLFDWCVLLMDAFYQQFLMTKDEKVTRVLENTMTVVKKLVQSVDAINNLLPVIIKLVSGKVEATDDQEITSYAIEMMEI